MEGDIGSLFQTADWKQEKHVPAIEVRGAARKGQDIVAELTVGKQIPHPNTTAHHISWIALYFVPDGGKFAHELGRFELGAHGASPQGPDTSGLFSAPAVSFCFRTDKSGVLYAVAACNIHGLWSNSLRLEVA